MYVKRKRWCPASGACRMIPGVIVACPYAAVLWVHYSTILRAHESNLHYSVGDVRCTRIRSNNPLATYAIRAELLLQPIHATLINFRRMIMYKAQRLQGAPSPHSSASGTLILTYPSSSYFLQKSSSVNHRVRTRHFRCSCEGYPGYRGIPANPITRKYENNS